MSADKVLKTTVGAAVALSGIAAVAAPLAPAVAAQDPVVEQERVQGAAESGMVKVANVQGEFAYDQTRVTSVKDIASKFNKVVATLCNAKTDFVADNPLKWRIAVSGDVENSYVSALDEVVSDKAVSQTMTCSCGGNPQGGRAIFNGDVKGVPVDKLIARAMPEQGANTVTFVSTDGKSVSLPAAYVLGRHAQLVYDINGEDLSASVGGNNQLWMAGAPAGLFLRDIIEIQVTVQDAPPEVPTFSEGPNVGITGVAQ